MTQNTLEGAIIDLDGTVYLGEQLVDGAREGIEQFRAAGIDLLFLTNNPIKPRTDYRDRLRALDIDAKLEEVINSASIAADYLATHHPNAATFVVGEPSLVAELRAANVEVTTDPRTANVVLASMDRSFDYAALGDVLEAFDEGPTPIFYATNPDRTCPTADGEIPDAAAMIGAIEGLTGRELDAVLGKPSSYAVEAAMRQLGTTPANCLVVGDRIATDVKMGTESGMSTALVLSGATDRADVAAAATEPDYVLESLGNIASVLHQ